MRLWRWLRCRLGYHIIWLGDLRRIDPASGEQLVDSPCLDCGTLLVATHGLGYSGKILALWHLDDYMSTSDAFAYALAVKLCDRTNQQPEVVTT